MSLHDQYYDDVMKKEFCSCVSIKRVVVVGSRSLMSMPSQVEVPEENNNWTILNNPVPRSEIEYFCTFLIILIVVVTGLVNLCLSSGASNPFWISLVTIGLSSVLPRAKIKKRRDGERAK